ncbi:hypothetical protein BDV10DRAFT_10658 [Aspergillus recurvatus]
MIWDCISAGFGSPPHHPHRPRHERRSRPLLLRRPRRRIRLRPLAGQDGAYVRLPGCSLCRRGVIQTRILLLHPESHASPMLLLHQDYQYLQLSQPAPDLGHLCLPAASEKRLRGTAGLIAPSDSQQGYRCLCHGGFNGLSSSGNRKGQI